MALISASKLSKYFGAQSVFQDVSVQIDDGKRIALVGVNGAGKTTLLRILAGLEEADSGYVARARAMRIGYMAQESLAESAGKLHSEMLAAFDHVLAIQEELRASEARLAAAGDAMQAALDDYAAVSQRFEEAGGYTYETEIARVLAGLGFSEEDWDKPLAIMSGGQKTRAALARLLLSHPDLLLLDEPTNHLDLAATEWLEDYLVHWPGAMVVVSHDRRFLDSVAQEVWDMAFGRVEGYPGNYTAYTRLRAERMERRRAEYEAQQERIGATEEFIRRYMAGQRTKEAKGRAKRLARLERLARPQEAEALHLRLTTHYRGGDHVLEATGLSVGYTHTLITCPNLLIQRGERVALIGPNGCGKSTFLKTVLGEVAPLAGETRLGANIHPAYYSQTHEGLNPQATVLDEILAYEPIIEKARGYLGRFLFSGDDVFKRIEQLSGGERSRVALAKLTMENANFLLLDEPTNHLDILSQEVLEDVLGDFPGTILFVSHDRYLIDALATHVWVVENGRLTPYEGNYTDYLEEKSLRTQRAAGERRAAELRRAEKARKAQKEPVAAGPSSSRLERERQVRLAALEDQIGALERRLAALNEEMTVAGQQGNGSRVWELSRDYQATENDLARAFAEWERAAG
jgi:ATP-binding cassette subfamily F protein 3